MEPNSPSLHQTQGGSNDVDGEGFVEHSRSFAGYRLTPSGGVDTTFGGDGVATMSFGANRRDEVDAAAVDSTGSIVAVGGSGLYWCCEQRWAVAKFTAAGTPATAFSADGRLLDPGLIAADACGASIAIDQQGRLLVAGATSGVTAGAVARLLPSGARDTSFSGDGRATIDDMFGRFAIRPVSDGKTVVVAHRHDDVTATRLTTGGLIDKMFGTSGEWSLTPPESPFNQSWLQGSTALSTGEAIFSAREVEYGVDAEDYYGRLFGVSGAASPRSIARAFSEISGPAVQSADRIVVSAYDYNTEGEGARFSASGVFDPSYVPAARGQHLYTSADDRVFAMGGSVLSRMNSNGTLDTFFNGGQVSFSAPIRAVAVYPDGRSVVALDGHLQRLTAAGTPDSTFGTGGKMSMSGQIRALTIDNSGRIVAAGCSSSKLTAWRVVG